MKSFSTRNVSFFLAQVVCFTLNEWWKDKYTREIERGRERKKERNSERGGESESSIEAKPYFDVWWKKRENWKKMNHKISSREEKIRLGE